MSDTKGIKVLAISGSVRAASVNMHILKAMEGLSPAFMHFHYCTILDQLPHFNPDITEERALPLVVQFREQIETADAVIICTPEYAFGVPGTLKNALDWIVSTGSLNEKPVIAISASPLYTGGDKALASLLLTLKALGTRMNEQSSLSIGAVKKVIDANGIIVDELLNHNLSRLIEHLIVHVEVG